MKNFAKYLIIISTIYIVIGCKRKSGESILPEELSNKTWVDISQHKSKFYKRCGEVDRSVITTTSSIQVELMETTNFEISRVEETADGYKIYTINSNDESEENKNKENKWCYNFRWINKEKGIAIWEYISADGKIDEGFTFITIDSDLMGKMHLESPPCEVCMSEKECDSIKKIQNNDAFLNSIAKTKIDNSWYKEYNVWLESYEDYYNYNYLIKISKDSSYIMERSLQDLLVPYQNKDTLFLYHKKSLFENYVKDRHLPEVKIIRIKDQYFIQSQLFDLENSISNKPTKYGFLVDEMR